MQLIILGRLFVGTYFFAVLSSSGDPEIPIRDFSPNLGKCPANGVGDPRSQCPILTEVMASVICPITGRTKSVNKAFTGFANKHC